MEQQYGENCLTGCNIYEWTACFESGGISLCDEQRNIGFRLQVTVTISKRINNIHFTPKGVIITSKNYCELLRLLKQNSRPKKRAKLSKSVILV